MLLAHGVSVSDHDLITMGRQLAVFIYLGAKHMDPVGRSHVRVLPRPGPRDKTPGLLAVADGLIPNLVAFNVGVELGQVLGLGVILIAMGFWRRSEGFARYAFAANVVVMTCGFILVGYQLAGYFT